MNTIRDYKLNVTKFRKDLTERITRDTASKQIAEDELRTNILNILYAAIPRQVDMKARTDMITVLADDIMGAIHESQA